MSADLAWQDPSAMEGEQLKRLHRHVGTAESASYWGGDAGNFGYPTFVQLGPRRADRLVVFYDGVEKPDLWKTSLY
jgi:hypothetical protein